MPPQNQNYTSPISLEAEPTALPKPDMSGQYYSQPSSTPSSAIESTAQPSLVYPEAAELTDQQPTNTVAKRKFLPYTAISLVALLILATPFFVWTLYNNGRSSDQTTSGLASKYPVTDIPLEDFATANGVDFSSQNVIVNGTLQANSSLVLTPGSEPLDPTAGQMYYDQTSNVLAYYDGDSFVPVSGGSGQVTSLGGQSGDILLGPGLSLADNTLNSSGVTSVQGASGAVTLVAGNGIVIDGLTVSNTGVTDLIAGSNVTITDNGNGTRTIDVPAAIGNVTTSGGTNGTIPLFTDTNNIQDSILSQSGATVTVGGALNITTALSVTSGGTGSDSLTTNGVLVGNGTSPILSVSTVTPDLCLRSTVGAPTWGACGSGVSSLNGQTGGVNIANASGAGGTVTIDNASTSTKGIARFNSTNFTAVGGDINTIQNINTTATPTFAGINTSTINPTGTLNIGGSASVQGDTLAVGTALLQGTIDLFDANGNLATIQTAGNLAADIVYTLPVPSGAATTADICLSTGNCAGAGSAITGNGTAGRLAVFDAAQNIVDSSIAESAGSINVLNTVTDFALQGGGLSVGDSGTNTAGSITIYSDNGNSITLDVASALSGDYTYSLPDVGQNAGICLTTGNCIGGGGGTAPADAQYITLSTNPDLANERVLTPGANLTAVDGGAGGNYTIATIQNPTFTTSVTTPLLQSSSALAINSTGAITLTPGSGTATADGDFNLTTGNQYQIDGTQISSAALSNDNNLAKLSQSQTFTGNNNTFQNAADSTNAFAIQNTAGANILNVDSTNGQLVLGEDGTLTGRIVFNHQTATGFTGVLVQGGLSADRTYTLPDESGTICLQSSANCGFEVIGSSFIQNGNSFATTATIGTNDANSLAVETNGTTQLTIAVGGATTFQNSTDSTGAFRVLNSGAVPLFQIDTTNSRAYIGNPTADATGALLVLDTKNTAGDPTGVNGGMYYNSNANKFRCFEGGAWSNCIGGGTEIVTFTGAGSFTKATYQGMKGIIVEAVGGGGAGGGAVATAAGESSVGGGGGGAGYCKRWITEAALTTSVTVTIGTGGVAASGASGGDGGDTTFGAFCTATGGDGGTAGIASSGTSMTLAGGGTGGSGSGGDINLRGADGTQASRYSNMIILKGDGGGSYGNAGRSRTTGGVTFATGTAGNAFGGGGSGAYNMQSAGALSARAGGAGADGAIVITIIY